MIKPEHGASVTLSPPTPRCGAWHRDRLLRDASRSVSHASPSTATTCLTQRLRLVMPAVAAAEVTQTSGALQFATALKQQTTGFSMLWWAGPTDSRRQGRDKFASLFRVNGSATTSAWMSQLCKLALLLVKTTLRLRRASGDAFTRSGRAGTAKSGR